MKISYAENCLFSSLKEKNQTYLEFYIAESFPPSSESK